jgi:hypothetical protein
MPGKMLPPPPSTKRPMRLRSIQGQNGGNQKKKGGGGGGGGKGGKTKPYSQDGKNKPEVYIDPKSSNAPIFLIKTYEMICICDDDLCAWSEDGETFVVKDPTQFAAQVIPKYFDHKNFSSFSRQLNFYGFKKVPNKTVRMDEYDKHSSGYVRFYNELFKRGRTELLIQIQRSTKNSPGAQNYGQEIKGLKDRVSQLETQLSMMSNNFHNLENQVRRLLYTQTEGGQMDGGQDYNQTMTYEVGEESNHAQDYNAPAYANQSGKQVSNHAQGNQGGQHYTATLAPHPNVKQIDPSGLPPPPDSDFNRNASLLRGLSSGFDERLFTTIMSDPNAKQADQSGLPPPPNDNTGRNASLLRGLSSGFDRRLFTTIMADGVSSNTLVDDMESSSSQTNGGDDMRSDMRANMVRIRSMEISESYKTLPEELPPPDADFTEIFTQVGV